MDEVSSSKMKCSCSHLTSFAGGYLVPPNEINFQKVYNEFRSPDEGDKFLVLVTVVTCFLVYLIVLIVARRIDKKEKAQVN